jgi:hypothetical protein
MNCAQLGISTSLNKGLVGVQAAHFEVLECGIVAVPLIHATSDNTVIGKDLASCRIKVVVALCKTDTHVTFSRRGRLFCMGPRASMLSCMFVRPVVVAPTTLPMNRTEPKRSVKPYYYVHARHYGNGNGRPVLRSDGQLLFPYRPVGIRSDAKQNVSVSIHSLLEVSVF